MSEHSYEHTLYSEQVRLLYRAAPEAYTATIFNAVWLSYIAQEVIRPALVYQWFLYMVLVTLLRSGLVYCYWRSTYSAKLPARTWNRLYAIGAASSAGGWGAAGILLYPPESLPHQVFVIFVLGGTAAGAVAALTPRIEVFLVFAFPTLIPVIMHFFLQTDKTHRMIGLIGLIYLLTLLVTAWRMYTTIRSSLALQHEKEDLLRQLRSLSLAVSRAEDRERKRLATSLHDNLAQTLALCKMKLHIIARKVEAQAWSASLAQVAAFVDESLTYTRTLMSELRPPQFGNEGDLGMAIAWVVGKLQRHGLTVSLEDDGQRKPVGEDQLTMVYQAVQELLYNVLKHANTGHATVSLRRVHHTVVITVRDEGCGFDIGRHDGRPSHNGFGLLNIRERAQQVGAQFHIDSRHGHGALVTITVPLKREIKGLIREPDVRSGSQVGRLDSTKPIRVMLVDDHEMIREGLRTIINAQEDLHVVGEASDGHIAMTRIRECQPHVILMDINMPTLDGVETTRRIKAELPDAIIIGLSVHKDERMALNMRDAGASAYLSKGGSFEALCETIRQTIEKQNCG